MMMSLKPYAIAAALLLAAVHPAYAAPQSEATTLVTPLSEAGGDLPMADHVVVDKSQRRLHLYRRGQLLRSYPVHLGLRPDGAKEYEGDFRTPEGRYTLNRRNSQSDYFLSIQVSYPNEQDLRRAKRMRLKPGGAIMIHGLPNTPKRSLDYYQRVDWTDGCIALSNADMVEVWLMTRAGTTIDIKP